MKFVDGKSQLGMYVVTHIFGKMYFTYFEHHQTAILKRVALEKWVIIWKASSHHRSSRHELTSQDKHKFCLET